MWSPLRLVAPALLLCLGFGDCGAVAAASPRGGTAGLPPAKPQPRVQVPVIDVDRATGQGRTSVYLRNDSNAPQHVLLTAGPLVQVGKGKNIDNLVTFAAERDHAAGAPTLELSLKPGEAARAQAVVSDVWDPGQFEADLLNGDGKIGTLKVASYAVNVKLDGPAATGASLSLVDSTPASLLLKNDDPVSYPLSYRLLVSGRQIAGNAFTIGPNGSALLEFVPTVPGGWGDPLARFQDLFKPAASDDNALLLYVRPANRPPDLAAPAKRIPLKASLSYFAPGSRDAFSYAIIVIVLTLGGVMSLVLSHLLPNQLERLNIKEQLNRLARTTSNLSSNVGSRLGVVVRVERSRLADLLKSRSTISPDFQGVVTQCTQGVASLSARVAMLQQMDLVMQQLCALVPRGVPPTQVDQIQAGLDKAAVLLGKDQPSDADLQAAQAAIAEAASGVNALGRPDDAFGQALAKRVQELTADLQARFAALPTFRRILAAVPGPYAMLTQVPAANAVAAALYTSVDLAAAKMALVREYVLLAEGNTDLQMQAHLGQREGSLLGYWRLNTWEALESARLLLREMQSDVYPERLQQALAAAPQEASIRMDPPFAYEVQPLAFKVRFHSQALDTAAAREEWACDWEFGDGLTESGWSVSHYYLLPWPAFLGRRQQKKFTVVATFKDAAGRSVTDSGTGKPVQVSREITVNPTRLSRLLGERTVAESIRLAAALLIAVFALVAGARDQLQKLDVLPGLVAVFLVGFGADTIKNLLTSK